jgi:hypothetical protein
VDGSSFTLHSPLTILNGATGSLISSCIAFGFACRPFDYFTSARPF